MFRDIYNTYTPKERRNIAIYIVGIMLYKFGLESFNGSITTLATDRFNAANAFAKVGILQGLNQAMQCVGSILIAPLIKRFNTRSVLSGAILGFCALTVILLICDAATGGRIRTDKNNYGSYNPDAIFPVYCATGIAYGMVELIRRVIPRDIVGGHVQKLKRMDSIVHVMYEVAGTIGAFSSAAVIKQLGNNYSFLVAPICFAFAGLAWRFLAAEGMTGGETKKGPLGYLASVGHGFLNFGRAVWVGAFLTLGSRKFCWLVPGYAFALFGHRYLENNIANIFAKSVLKDSSYQQIIVGGSNFGELLGAMTVFFTANGIPTPIPFIRIDALLLLIVWYLPFYHPEPNNVNEAWKIAATFIPISFGWAAGDVSLAAYIQSSLARVESKTTGVSALGAVMSFLYVLYIVIYAILSPTLGKYVDSTIASSGVHAALYNIGGVHFTVLSAIILLATLIPKGALSLNPTLLHNEDLNSDLTPDEVIATEGRDRAFMQERDEKDGSSNDSLKEKQRISA
ncbi:hypothetical protein M408DRAFT_61521 [Serendipita vermifera MAFF 305830]|uniref:Major facilitator superfamily (MFS) profile domain-containing protein n=1 Tax=Serendipita vermifera MAFF 305830 TaxID=933852 RepID=A0A0C3B8V1_SERVB|nr:hypothetical protein M408DRAFT_61521 [Serendipita vermifera MAFF 305830]